MRFKFLIIADIHIYLSLKACVNKLIHLPIEHFCDLIRQAMQNILKCRL